MTWSRRCSREPRQSPRKLSQKTVPAKPSTGLVYYATHTCFVCHGILPADAPNTYASDFTSTLPLPRMFNLRARGGRLAHRGPAGAFCREPRLPVRHTLSLLFCTWLEHSQAWELQQRGEDEKSPGVWGFLRVVSPRNKFGKREQVKDSAGEGPLLPSSDSQNGSDWAAEMNTQGMKPEPAVSLSPSPAL